MNVFSLLKSDIENQILALEKDGVLPAGSDTARITVEPPRDAAHGDAATNAAMLLSKAAGMKPRDLAEKLAEKLGTLDHIEQVEIAGPGFINLRMADDFWLSQITEVLENGKTYGNSNLGANTKMNVEYVSANPTGPMHVGHCRGAVVGDVLANLLAKAGYDVTKEYYINDAGAQVDVLARSLHLRYREALGETIDEIPAGLYPGDYLVAPGKKLAARDGNKWVEAPEENWLEEFRGFAIVEMMALIKEDLRLLGVDHDVFTSEAGLVAAGKVQAAFEHLEKKGDIYVGVLEPPKGKTPDDWEPRPQTLFRATEFGDDVDRPLKKSDGSWTYFASDIAYHFDKYERGFNHMIDIFGADHGGYVKRMKAATKAITGGEGDLDVKLCQLVSLFDNGEPVKMSKRAGTFVTLRDVVERVGKDVVRFIMLTRKNDATLDFDFAKVTEQSKDNPVFYVQYAHARVNSVFRQAREAFPNQDFSDAALVGADLSALVSEDEKMLVRRMAEWPRIVEQAAVAHEPHRIAFFLSEIAAEFHALWNKGRDNTALRFIVADDLAVTQARLAMIRAAALVIASGLDVLGVAPVEEM
ncbi:MULTISPECIES: arginine--tRNA ligase [Thalassospira]|uniref:arginine--tRNA ligase n=1 Tax=Thalassospira TaxID=168934 RepID=UPI0008DD6880|nr:MULTISPECIES: arginine--tRNA ligase [Thalassospira]MAB31975.1 arginine--tRNA ligase [Thalassospira sp.]MDM7975331.1 arginine--tRNA ligase [Thalassospira xiamenensis]OHZ01117.1 arginine--tRNA ligase [Thalassospira sp. MIT1004]HBS21911.1 arginine--tRNA ligase [Thalassospira sp.]